MTWYQLWKRLGKQPLFDTLNKNVEIEDSRGNLHKGKLKYDDNGSHFKLIMDNINSNWVSVKDKLPEAGERVIVTEGNFVCEAYMSYQFIDHGNVHWKRYNSCSLQFVPTYWMSFPKPPEVR